MEYQQGKPLSSKGSRVKSACQQLRSTLKSGVLSRFLKPGAATTYNFATRHFCRRRPRPYPAAGGAVREFREECEHSTATPDYKVLPPRSHYTCDEAVGTGRRRRG